MLAKTNRNRKLPLNEAWMHYWPVMFERGAEWHSDLEAEIRRCLYFPGETGAFLSEVNSKLRPPPWADDLKLVIKNNAVAIEFMDKDFGTVPLFMVRNLSSLGNWKNNNPLNQIAKETEPSRADIEACRDLFIAAVLFCGNYVFNRMLDMITETENPTFEIYCRPNGDVFASEKLIPVFGLSEVCRIDVATNTLQGRMQQAVYSYVKIKKKSLPTSQVGRHGSFHENDAGLVEEMKSLIDAGQARNVKTAAEMLCSRAKRRKNSKDESVVRRLQDRYSEKYPATSD